jgi:uncharacterized protein YyaL (SSP411 family)
MTPGRRVAAAAILWLACALGAPAQAGRLSEATSPYLLSHAEDAIDWHPWGEEALQRARRDNKLIFLSIGYASCYWCHVLARTTFVDPRVIETLNTHFVSILVDREERPDLDAYFMDIMEAMAGLRGSPANFLLTPDAVPLFAAGYLAPEPEYGAPGFVTVLQTLVTAWTDNRDGVLEDARSIGDQLRGLAEAPPGGTARRTGDPRDAAVRSWSGAFDQTYGGFGGGSKFLLPNVLSFLLRRGVWRRDEALLENLYRTLDHMAAGGVRDQLGGAFHRYAVDRFWQVPHFEIMLDQNALLARLYLEAYQASGKPRYAVVAREILEDLLARFRLPDGGFAAALDSETEAKEGFFYTWTAEEVRSALGAQAAGPFIKAHLDQAHGLVRGRSILRYLDGPPPPEARDLLSESRPRLLEARGRRAAPLRDDKVVTSWNALAVSAFAKAAQILDDARYLQVAQEEIRHLLVAASDARRLIHSRRAGKAGETVFLDDYAFLVQALLDLYETDFRVSRLDDARRLMETLVERFQEGPGRPFRFTPIDRPSDIPARRILDEEGMPSGNAAALTALHRLVLFGAEAVFEEQARAVSRGLEPYLAQSAAAAPGLLGALDFSPDEAHEIVIVGNLGDADTRSLLRQVYKSPLHGTVLAVIAPDVPRDNETWPLLAARPLLEDRATAYVCRKRLCDLPVDTPAELSAQLDKLVSQVPAP